MHDDLPKHPTNYLMVLAKGSTIMKDLKIQRVPTVVVIDQLGKIVKTGTIIQYDKLKEIIDDLLGSQK